MRILYFFAFLAICIFEGCTTEPVIQFQDNLTKQICITHWDANKDGEISYREANMIVDIGNAFQASQIKSFEELKYFSGLHKIGKEAFCGCDNLENIVIPDGVTTIDAKAFYGCSNIKSIYIPYSVRTIASGALWGCTGRLIIDSSLMCIDYNEDKNSPNLWLKGANFTSVYIGSKVERIGDYALAHCDKITEVIIDSGVASIGNGAFKDCLRLKQVSMADSVKELGLSVFYNCNNLTNITLSNSIKEIPSWAFKDCRSLANIIIPNCVEKIGLWAFQDCRNLTSVKLGEGIRDVGTEAFSGCSKLSEISIPPTAIWFGENVFKGCTSLPIENDIRYAGSCVVEVVNKNRTSYKIKENCAVIGNRAFEYCRNLKSIIIPSTVNVIGSEAFYCCSSLNRITIPESVTFIGSEAFYCCTGELEINSKLVEENYGLVEQKWSSSNYWLKNTNFSSIKIGNKVEKLGDYVFYGKWKLKQIFISENVHTIGNGALDDCEVLARVYCKAQNPPAVASLSLPSTCKIYVPRASVDAYQSAPYWGDYTIVGYNFE